MTINSEPNLLEQVEEYYLVVTFGLSRVNLLSDATLFGGKGEPFLNVTPVITGTVPSPCKRRGRKVRYYVTIYTVVLNAKTPTTEDDYKFTSEELALQFFEAIRWNGFPNAEIIEEQAIENLTSVLQELGVPSV